MKIVLFTHPNFTYSQSMPKYAAMLKEGMESKGHRVEIWTAQPFFFRFKLLTGFKKWFGYIDQFIIFPIQVKYRLRKYPDDTVFVFTDQALGAWVPLVRKRSHIIHCHDFLAQLSALEKISENKVSRSGKIYQAFIRWGYRKGSNFISISKKTQGDLHDFLLNKPIISEVVYNGLNQKFEPGNVEMARKLLSNKYQLDLSKGYILHVGGNLFYKNRKGVLEIYIRWRENHNNNIPLLMVGEKPNNYLLKVYNESDFQGDIHFLERIDDQDLRLSYQGAKVLLYPSIYEGFGWPIAEALASGCPVITTNEAPMNEVGGEAAFYIPKYPYENIKLNNFLNVASKMLNDVICNADGLIKERSKEGIIRSQFFDTNKAIDRIETIYLNLNSEIYL